MYTFGHRVDLLWVIALTCAQAVRSPSTPPCMAYWVRPKVLWKGAYIEGWKLLQRYIYFIKLFGSILPALSLWTNTRHNLQLAIAFWLVYPTPWQNIAGITGPTVHFCTNFYFILTAARTSFCHLLVGELQVVLIRTGWFFNCPVVMVKLPFLLLWAAMQCFLCLGYNHSVFL